jgi:hypothetical protein
VSSVTAFGFPDDTGVQFYLDYVWAPRKVRVADLPPVVGCVGAIGAGKSYGAKALMSALGYRPMSFATALKEICCDVFVPIGAERRHFFGTQADKAEPIPALGGATGRRVLELVGTNGFRAAFPQVWVKLALAGRPEGQRFVIDDVRFENEAAGIRDAGGMIIRVARQGQPLPESTGHVSDEEWRRIRPDALVEVPPGDLEMLRSSMVRAVIHEASDRARLKAAPVEEVA